jgi:hypothetical protein
MLANPGFLSAADFAQLQGLAFDEKIRLMRAILNEVRQTRTAQQIAQFGRFTWQEMGGPKGEVVFMGQGAPATTMRPTVVVIFRDGRVYRMLPAGITNTISMGPPRIVDVDLQLGTAQLMVT